MAMGKLGAGGRGFGKEGSTVLGTVGMIPNTLYVVGDSTAKGDGADTAGGKWAAITAGGAVTTWTLSNAGVSGQSIADMVTGMQADTTHRRWFTAIVDKINVGETEVGYMASLAQAVSLIPSGRFYIHPQIPKTDGTEDSGAARDLLNAVNADIIATYPNNTLSSADQAALIAALADSTTRADGLHRNDKGQAIEAMFISSWLTRRGWRPVWPEATSLIARFTTDPGALRNSYVNGFIEQEKYSGNWAVSDVIRVWAAHEETSGALNWKGTNYTATKTGTVTFTADQGRAGNGTTGYHHSGFDPTTAGSPNFVKDSAHLSLFVRTNVAESVDDIGGGNSKLATRNADNSIGSRMMQATTNFNSNPNTSSIGSWVASRASSSLMNVYVNNVNVTADVTHPSVAITAGEILEGAGAAAATLSTKQIGFVGIGGAIDIPKRTWAVWAWMKAVGAA
jgi:hypothetical protein